MPAVLVNGVAHALEVSVEHPRQHGRLQPLAHRGVTREVGKERRHHLALGRGLGPRRHAVGDEPLHDARRREPGARHLETLEVGGGRLELRLEALVAPPLAMERTCEDHHEHEHGAQDDRLRHA